MTPSNEKSAPKFWAARVERADKAYNFWSKKFKTDALVKYYEGFQWLLDDNISPNFAGTQTNYVINLFFSAIETKVPSLLFQNPRFHCAPKPKSVALDPDAAFQTCTNFTDILNDWCSDADNHVGDVVEGAIYDAFSRFGIVELGYSADWIDNPYAQKPAYVKDFDVIGGNTVIKGTDKVPRNEKLYIKHIPAKTFRVSSPHKFFLEQNDWCGYYEYIKVLDLKNDKNLKNTEELNGGYIDAQDLSTSGQQEPNQVEERQGAFEKVWTIYDMRQRKKIMWAQSSNKVLLTKKYKHLPLIDLRFKRRPDGGWYPLPLTFNWISPQNELNEVREANKMHRRRFKRVYQTKTGAVSPDQKELFFQGPDGTLVETNAPIDPVPNADLGSSAVQGLMGSKDDFNTIAGTLPEDARGQGDRTTATAAAITNNRAQIRESRERIVVANFLCRIGKLALKLIESNFVNPVYTNSQPSDQFLGDVGQQPEPRVINPLTDFGEDTEFDVNIELDTMSPLVNEEEKRKFIEFLTLLSQFPQFGMSPVLIRELAFRTGYRNEKVIGEFQKMAQLQMIGMVEQGKQNLDAQGGANGADAKMKQMAPPTGQQIKSQLQGQGVPING